jgi:Flp pilus assembly protein TadD
LNKSLIKKKQELIIKNFNIQNFDKVENLSKEFIKKFPNNSFGWKALGIVLKKKGNFKKALDINQKTISVSPNDPEAYYNLANTFINLSNLKEAEKYYHKAISLNPNYFEAYNNLGILLKELGRLDESEQQYRKAISLNPNYFEAYNNLGILLKELGRLDESEQQYRKAISLNPNYFEAYNNLGITLRELGRLEQSEQIFKKLTETKPQYFEAFNNFGITLRNLRKFEDAKQFFKTAIKLKPDNAEYYFNLGITERDLGKLENSELWLKKAISLNPNYFQAYNDLGITLSNLKRLKESDYNFNKAIELNSHYAEAYTNLSYNCLIKKDFKKASELYEWRWKIKKNLHKKLFENKQKWNGEKNKKVLVLKEQGIGDQLMFSSIFCELSNLSKKLIVNCDERLTSIFNRSFPSEILYKSNVEEINDSDFDFYIYMGSLGSYFRKNLKDYSLNSKRFIRADDKKTSFFKTKLQSDKNQKIIGISWNTKSSNIMSNFRNIELKNLIENLKNENLKFVNLQYGDVSKEIKEISKKFGINIITFPDLDYKNDIDGLASLISACDKVIAIDNFTSHLSGSLGKETKLLLPFTSDPRWGLEDRFSYIYDSVKIFRQSELGNWSNVFEELTENGSL